MPGHDSKLKASIPASVEMSPRNAFGLDPFTFASIHLLLSQTKKHSSRSRRQKIYGRLPQDLKRYHGCKRKGRKALTYLKPGALARFRDAQRSRRLNATTETVFESRSHGVNEASRAIQATPGRFGKLFGPICPQRKKLVAPRTTSNLVSATHTSHNQVAIEPSRESRLESLPLELLVRIVCSLNHDQLKPAFHVCKRLRRAVLIARQCHFDFSTPNRNGQEPLFLQSMRSKEAVNIPSTKPRIPQAPRPPLKPAQTRISQADIKHFALPLLQSSSRSRRLRPHCMRRFAYRATASHRALFYENEVCQTIV